jgi:hypothetical protein
VAFKLCPGPRCLHGTLVFSVVLIDESEVLTAATEKILSPGG